MIHGDDGVVFIVVKKLLFEDRTCGAPRPQEHSQKLPFPLLCLNYV
jgi:hypothetical protein